LCLKKQTKRTNKLELIEEKAKMIFLKSLYPTNINSVLLQFKNNLHTSECLRAGKLWRQEKALPKLQTKSGPLIDLPDYSFVGSLTI
jgi:hypothetical protein